MARTTDTEDHLGAFSELLRGIRAETGLSLKDLEKVTATSDSSLSRYLSGAICPPWSVVERLCGVARRDPTAVREAWERARRQRFVVPAAPRAGGGTPVADAVPAPSRPAVVRWHVLVAGTVLAVVLGLGALVLVRPWAGTATGRACPWQYVVTDGNPDPVIIFDRPDADGRRIGRYQPAQVFYVPEPARRQNGRMRTVDGWINQGDWIRRYPGRCRTQE